MANEYVVLKIMTCIVDYYAKAGFGVRFDHKYKIAIFHELDKIEKTELPDADIVKISVVRIDEADYKQLSING